MITCTIACIKLQFEDKNDLVQYIRKLTHTETENMLKAKTVKEQRYHQGKVTAFTQMGDLIANSDIP